MKYLILICLVLTGCAMTPEQEDEWRQFVGGMDQHFQNEQKRGTAGSACGDLSIPPPALGNCRNSCINGQWAKVCN